MSKTILLMTTFPDFDTAQQVAKKIVQAKLAACVNILPAGKSVYIWKDELCQDNEITALIKTTEQRYNELESLIKQEHPYELPEIIATPIVKGSEEYLNWLHMSTET